MIEALRHDDIIEKVGGRFKLTTLIQRRWLQLMQGARPMVDPKGLTELEVVIREIEEGKIVLETTEGSSTDDEQACIVRDLHGVFVGGRRGTPFA